MKLQVGLKERSYPVHIVEGDLSGLGAAVAERLPPGPAFVVCSPRVADWYLEPATRSLVGAGFEVEQISIPDGEAHKSIETWQALLRELLQRGADRSTPLVALGGGVTGDLVGFAAATLMRGVPLVQVPTTLLAMVDSSVGGKTAVNTPEGKNLVGAFHQPSLVYAAMATLDTLPDREFRSGLGELVKHGAIRDRELFERCLSAAPRVLAREPALLRWMLTRSCQVKARVVEADEREQGLRVVLNFGHTVGHALESTLGHGAMPHGECVGLGMLGEARWSARRGTCDGSVPRRIEAVLRALGLPTRTPAVDRDRLQSFADRDKKATRGMLRTAVIEEIGRVTVTRIALSEARQMLDELSLPPAPDPLELG